MRLDLRNPDPLLDTPDLAPVELDPIDPGHPDRDLAVDRLYAAHLALATEAAPRIMEVRALMAALAPLTAEELARVLAPLNYRGHTPR
jgi:hypothetical protein